MEKECKACGKFFDTDNKKRLYCDDCREHGYRTRVEYDRSVAASKAYAQFWTPKVWERTCAECGKVFRTTDGSRHLCSQKCMTAHKIKKMECTVCHKNILEAYTARGEEVPESMIHTWLHFCSDECRNVYEDWKHPEKVCKNCGNPFRSPNKYFCSADCSIAYRRAHPAQPKKRMERQQPRYVSGVCLNCGKSFRKIQLHPDDGTYLSVHFCGTECRNSYLKKQKDKKERQAKEAYIERNGLCSICRTSYKDCPRMQSNFRVKPKGAMYRDGKIMKCPLYKGEAAG